MALGQGRERFALLVEGRNAALVADGNRFQDIAILIGRERQRMADARIGRIALVVEGNRLARMREEDCMTVCPARLKRRDREIALGDGVRPSRKRYAVQSIDLLALSATVYGRRVSAMPSRA